MRTTIRQHLYEIAFFLILSFGLIAIAQAQTGHSNSMTVHKHVRIEVEITENGKMVTSAQEINLDHEIMNGDLDEIVVEIEKILKEAIAEEGETDIEITIIRNKVETAAINQQMRCGMFMTVIPESYWTKSHSS
jgi:hypothetical protein